MSYPTNGSAELDQLIIPSTVKEIRSYAFSGLCVKKLNIQEGVGNLGRMCFMNIKTDSILLPSSVTFSDVYCFGYSPIKYVDASKVNGKLNQAFSYCGLLNKIILIIYS